MTTTREHLENLSKTPVTEAIFSDVLLPVLTAPPFIPTASMINLRDVGAVPGSALPKARFYRCATLEAVAQDPSARAWLANNVKRIFDLRKPEEVAMHPDPVIEGVENVWYEMSGEDPNPKVADFVEDAGRKGWKHQFVLIANSYKPVFRAVLEHVRDRPTEPILFHCAAGRDRTGFLAGLLQTLAGTPHDVVLLDYMLSRVGVEPAREMLKHYALIGSGAEDEETPGFLELVDLKPAYFEALVELLEEEYGGWEGYVVSEQGLGMTTEDLETVKRNLRA